MGTKEISPLCRIELFGGLRVRRDGEVIDRFRTRKAALLLAYLAYYRDQAHSRDTLVDLLWPEAELDAGRNNLSKALSSLRRQLEPPGVPVGAVLRADRHAVSLNPRAVSTDVAEFEAAIAHARASRGALATERLADAVELYRGELLRGYAEEWILPEQRRLAERFWQAARDLIGQREAGGDLPGAIEVAGRAVAADPLREEAHGELIRLYAAAGQAGEARRRHRELVRLLERELGVSPSPAVQALARQLDRTPEGAPPSAGTGQRAPAGREVATGPHQPAGRAGVGRLTSGTVTLLLIAGELPAPEQRRAVGATASRSDLLQREIRRHGGREIEQDGGAPKPGASAVTAVFSDPVAAARCALGIQQAFSERSRPEPAGPARPRMALRTGPVEEHGGKYRGAVLVQAQRVLLAAHPGQILCSEGTAALLRHEQPAEIQLAELGLYEARSLPAPERLFQLASAGAPPERFPPPLAGRSRPGRLPLQLTRFFGREVELAQLVEMLAPDRRRSAEEVKSGSSEAGSSPLPLSPSSPRLLTLTGPAGIGKTRLAFEVAERLEPAYEGAVWYVRLQDLAEPRHISAAILEALRLPPRREHKPLEQVAEALAAQPALLLLDNLEHLVDEGAELIHQLLEQAAELRCLVTSRRRLNLPAEREFAVTPLPVPTATDSPAEVARCPSVRLFVDRAQAVRPDFQATPARVSSLAALCAHLEGLPLALEIAAARVQLLTPTQMLAQLKAAPGSGGGGRFDLLAARRRGVPERHRTLRGALDWSYQMLPPELQRFFARLSVFRGGWTVEAAAEVCEEPRALEYLEEMREYSLVLVEEAGEEVRFRMLETLREYADAQLAPAEREGLRRRHARYYWALVGRANASECEVEMDNLHAALEWCAMAGGDPDVGWRLALRLRPFWQSRGRFREACEYLGRFLAEVEAGQPCADRAMFFCTHGAMADSLGDTAAARSSYEKALAVFRRLSDEGGVAGVLNNLALLARGEADYATARRLLEESLVLARRSHAKGLVSMILTNLGRVALRQGEHQQARDCAGGALQIQPDDQDALYLVAEVAIETGDYGLARACLERALPVSEAQDREQVVLALELSSRLATALGDCERAARLLAGAEHLCKPMGLGLPAADRARWERLGAGIRARVSPEVFEKVSTEGREMCCSALVAEALAPMAT